MNDKQGTESNEKKASEEKSAVNEEQSTMSEEQVKKSIFVCGDSATDKIIVDKVKLDDTPFFSKGEEIRFVERDASGKQLYNIIDKYQKIYNSIDTDFF